MTPDNTSSPWINELNDQYFQRLYRLACANLRGTGCESVAEDIVQEVLLEAHLHQEMLKSHPNPVGWLYQTTFNFCRNAVRTQQHKNRRNAFSLDHPNAPDIEDQDAEMQIYRQLEKAHSYHEAVEYIKSRVSPEEYVLFERRYIEKHSLQRLHLLYGISSAAVKMRLHRLRKKICKILDGLFEYGTE